MQVRKRNIQLTQAWDKEIADSSGKQDAYHNEPTCSKYDLASSPISTCSSVVRSIRLMYGKFLSETQIFSLPHAHDNLIFHLSYFVTSFLKYTIFPSLSVHTRDF